MVSADKTGDSLRKFGKCAIKLRDHSQKHDGNDSDDGRGLSALFLVLAFLCAQFFRKLKIQPIAE